MSSARVPYRVRRMVAERAAYLCEYCCYPEDYSPDPFCIEHLRPRSKRGTNVLSNLVFACVGCNSYKSNRTEAFDPVTQTEVPLFHQRRQRWHEHFAWSPDHTLMVGLTAIGRATIIALKLNRPGVVNVRHALIERGRHPPSDPAANEA